MSFVPLSYFIHIKTPKTIKQKRTLRDSIDVVRAELENSARTHLNVAAEIRNQLEKPAGEFLANQSAIRKNVSLCVFLSVVYVGGKVF